MNQRNSLKDELKKNANTKVRRIIYQFKSQRDPVSGLKMSAQRWRWPQEPFIWISNQNNNSGIISATPNLKRFELDIVNQRFIKNRDINRDKQCIVRDVQVKFARDEPFSRLLRHPREEMGWSPLNRCISDLTSIEWFIRSRNHTAFVRFDGLNRLPVYFIFAVLGVN